MIPLSVWDPKKRCRVLNPEAFNQQPESDMAEYKTVLSPNAPWPDEAIKKPKPVARVRVLPPPGSQSKRANTDRMFEQWAAKQVGIKDVT